MPLARPTRYGSRKVRYVIMCVVRQETTIYYGTKEETFSSKINIGHLCMLCPASLRAEAVIVLSYPLFFSVVLGYKTDK